MEKLKLLDLFSGIGGFSLGLEASGHFETVAFCEIEEYPRRVLRNHWPEVPIYDDIRTLSAKRLRADGIAVDAICGGFPCQDVSNSGTKEGLSGSRSGLWFEYVRLIREIRPRVIFVENVTALLGRGIDRVLGSMAEIGYDAEWHCIPASYVGAPHRRDRVWIVAYPAGWGQSVPRGRIYAEHSAADAYREADHVIHAVQGGALPFLCGGHDGVPKGLGEPMLKALGNAVVPLIPKLLGLAYGPHVR